MLPQSLYSLPQSPSVSLSLSIVSLSLPQSLYSLPVLFYFTVDESKPKDREIKNLTELNDGEIVRGYVKSCSDVGVFVR